MDYVKKIQYKKRTQPIDETYETKREGNKEIHKVTKQLIGFKPEESIVLTRTYITPKTFTNNCHLCQNRAERKISIMNIDHYYCHQHGIDILRNILIYKSAQQLWSSERLYYAKKEVKD
jgi:hypothetical protein